METHNEHHWLTKSPVRNLLERSRHSRVNSEYGIDYYTEYAGPVSMGTDYVESLLRDEVRYVDAQLRRLWRALERTGRAESCLFILCADHGEGFGEQEFVYHVEGVTEPMVRTPLLVRSPGLSPGEVTSRVSLSWIYSTVKAYFGSSASPDLRRPETYLPCVGAENTGRLTELLSNDTAVPERLLRDRLVVYDDDAPNRKFAREDDEYTIYEIEPRGLFETAIGSGGEDVVTSFIESLDVATSDGATTSDATRENLRDLGYI